MVQTACFSRDQLRDFSLGCVSAEAEERIAEHLDQCESCQEAAAECDRSADSLVAALRVPDDVPSEEDMHCDAALARARQLAVGSAGARHERTEPIRLREYELLRKLGEGGMGTVYLARHTRLDRIVALKVLPPDRMRDSSAVARFEREMRAVGGLDHPSIVRATDAGDVDGTHFLVMEYVEGLDLSSLVERLGPIGMADACELVRQAALGLQHVHERGMVHRDIKPSNLMLTPRGEVKILDLGLALLQRGDGELQGITTVGRFMGTLDYMAPEQADDSHEVDIRADVYGLGATLYRLICGVPPFAGNSYRSPLKKLKALATEPVPRVRDRRPEVPAGLAQVIERMLAKEPADRFAAPAEVAEALQPFTTGSDLAKLQQDVESQLAPQVDSVGQVSNLPDQAGGTRRRSRRRVLVVLFACLALVGAAAIYVETEKGTLVIQSPDPGIEVLIRRSGKPVDDWELQRGENRTTVRSGSYEIILIGASDGLRVKDGAFTLTRGDEHVATIERLAQRKSTTDSAQKTSAIPSPAQRREPTTPAAASDRQALQGTWEVVSGEQSGENDTQANVAQWLKVRFGPNEFVIWKGQSVEAKGPWMLHPAEQPHTIILSSIHSRGSADRKIYWARYELNGDELRLAISDQKSPADFRPDKDTSALWLRRTKGPDESRPQISQSGVEVKIFSFANANAAEAAEVARQLIPEDRAQIATDARTNSVVVQGRAEDLDTLTAIFLRLDEKAGGGSRTTESLQGVWEFEGLQDGGRSAPAEVLKSLKLILTKERFQFWEKDRIDKQGTYELDPSAEPKTITFYESGANKPTRGIYRREHGRLWITLNETPGGERPNAFVSERGSPNDTLMELRQTKQPVPPIEAGEESERAKKDTAQPAGRAQPITSEAPSSLDKTSEGISFNFKNAPWPDVLKLLAEKAGLTLDLRDVPPGEFTYTDSKEYTPAEALDVLNGYLISRGHVLVRRDNFLVSLQIGNIPENLIPTVTIDELPQRGRNELLNVVFPLEGAKAEDWVDEVRNVLDVVGSKGQVAVLERSNAIAVTDFGGNLRRVQGLLSDVLAKSAPDAGPGESLQGVWEVKGAQDSGRKTPAEEIKALKLVFAGERFDFRGLQQRGTYKTDSTVEPKSITFFEDGKEKPVMGIYRLENDKLWIVFNEGRDGERPDAFASEPDSPNDVLLELRRTEEPVPEQGFSEGERQSRSNLRRIAVAMHSYRDPFGAPGDFPPAVVLGPDGKTPHSWRVALLPFLGHRDLYQEYRLDEPWDSEHNKKLLGKMPGVYRHPFAPTGAPNTAYFVIAGQPAKRTQGAMAAGYESGGAQAAGALPVEPSPPGQEFGTLFSDQPQKTGPRLSDVQDGTSNTLLVVEDRRDVPWTKPEDIPHRPNLAPPKLGGWWSGGFYAALADGEVKFFPEAIHRETLRKLISPRDAWPIDWKSLANKVDERPARSRDTQ